MSNKMTIDNMLKQQLRTGNVLDESIINLYKNIYREEFVPVDFKEFAYSDMQIPLPNQQTMLTPLEEAIILQELALTGEENVLEIGTGSGFLTALLSKLSRKVTSVEYFEEFTKKAKILLEKYKCDNVELITADASRGYVEKAPYDVIIISGGIKELTKIQRLQLLPQGKLIAIIGNPPVMQAKLYQLSHEDKWTEKLIFETNIPPLIDKLHKKQFIF